MEWYVIVLLALAILFPFIYLLYLLFSSPPTPTTSSTTLKGREGYVLKKVTPWDISGKVRVVNGNKIWSATAESVIEKGTRVKIIKSKGVHVVVEKVE